MRRQNLLHETYQRFSVLQRLLHILIAIGFTGLAITGFARAFSSVAVVRALSWFLGGADGIVSLHRFFAVFTYACVVVHGLWLFYYKIILKGSLSGRSSMLPGKKDLAEFLEHIRYLLAQRKDPPSFDRFAYWEKMDYWAFFIGMQTMGITGLFMWFPEFFSSFLPGYFINLAQVLHFYEALMAVIVKIFIHTIVVTLRPEVYPADLSIFTGKVTGEEMMRHHPGEWEALRASTEGAAVVKKETT